MNDLTVIQTSQVCYCAEREGARRRGERREGREEGVFLAMKVCGEYSFSEVVFYRNIESLTLFVPFLLLKGLCSYLLEKFHDAKERGVVIGFDARHNSDRC